MILASFIIETNNYNYKSCYFREIPMKHYFCTMLIIIMAISFPITAFATEDVDTLPSGLKYSDIEKTIDTYVTENENTTAAVSVSVFTSEEVIFEKAYGYVDIENSVANDSNAVFEWGSCTKLLTWVSVMQLVELGELDLNEDIRTYLPDGFLTKLRYDTPITLTNLMNHNAGWQETLTDLFLEDTADVNELGEALRMIEPEQVHEPGKVVAYSNWGAALAGYIVECVSGQIFSDYVHEHFFEPLGMEHTALNATLSDNPWVSQKRTKQKCYTTENELLGTCLYYLSLYPAGMATGTLSDFVKFARAFAPDEGVSSLLFQKADTLGEMLSPTLYYNDEETGRNCHGFWTDELGVPVIWHNGGTLGSSSWFALDPKTGTGIVILTNQSDESVYNCGLLPLVFGKHGSETGAESEDISGMYVSARTCFEGYAKLYSMLCLMQLTSEGEGIYSIPGTNNTVTSMNTGSYVMELEGRKQFILQTATAVDGHTLLQIPGQDYIEVNGYVVIAKYILLLLFIFAALYSIFALIFRIIGLLRHRNMQQTMRGYKDVVNFAVVSSAMIFVSISMTLFSETPMFSTIQWSLMFNALLALIPIAYAVSLAIKWKNLDCSKKEKAKLIGTGVVGLIMTINVIFWDTYKFW